MADAPGTVAAGQRLVALVGNRNVGKTTLFNQLTGLRHRVGNYPGVTVERREGDLQDRTHGPCSVVDLPGANSLVPRSPDEAITAAFLCGEVGDERPDAVVVVMDATQLRRGLFMLSQVIELGLPVVVAFNMLDDARREGLACDVGALSRALGGLAVVPTVGVSGDGLAELRRELLEVTASSARPEPCSVPGVHGLPEPSARRWRTLREVVGMGGLEETETLARWRWVQGVLDALGREEGTARRKSSDRLDRFMLHPLLGPLIFLAVMGLLFQSVFALAEAPMELIDGAMGSLGDALGNLLPEGLLRGFVQDGVIAGVGAVVIFLPQILILFLFLGLLEDTGYMTRAAFLVDAPLRRVGLSGRSFVPLLSSFACAVPGIMAARTIEDRRERFMTIMVAPLMTCSARLPVYAILIGTFIPERTVLGFLGLQGLVLLGLYLGGILLAGLAALVMNRILAKSESPMVLELPRFRRPHLRRVLQRMGQRAGLFLKRAGTVILVMSMLIWALSTFPRPEEGTPSSSALEQSYAGQLGKFIEPVIEPLGYDWRIGIGVIGSFAAREVFLATMAVVYAVEEGEDEAEGDARLAQAMTSARWRSSDRPVYSLPTVLSLLVFYMVALQCMSTVAVVGRELGGWRWAALQIVWMTGLAWVLAWITYSVAGGIL